MQVGITTSGESKQDVVSRRDQIEYEYQIRDLKIDLSKVEKELSSKQIDLDFGKEELASYGIKFYAVQRERDLLKLKIERYEKLLNENNLLSSEETQEKNELEEQEIELVEEFHEKLE